MLDNHLGIQLTPAAAASAASAGVCPVPGCRGERAFSGAHAACGEHGLRFHMVKAVRWAAVFAAWGCCLEGDVGWLGIPRYKLVELAILTLEVAWLGIVDLELLECLLGSWAYALSFRRHMFCILHALYRQAPPASAGDGPAARLFPFRLHPWARNELILLGALAASTLCNLRAPV